MTFCFYSQMVLYTCITLEWGVDTLAAAIAVVVVVDAFAAAGSTPKARKAGSCCLGIAIDKPACKGT